MGIVTARLANATPLNPPIGLASENVCASNEPRCAVRDLNAAGADHLFGGFGVADGRIDPSDEIALRRHDVQARETTHDGPGAATIKAVTTSDNAAALS